MLLNFGWRYYRERRTLDCFSNSNILEIIGKTVRRLISEKRLQASKLGDRSWRIRSCDIDSYVKSNSNGVDLLNIDEPDTCSCQPTVANVPNENESAPRLISLFLAVVDLIVALRKLALISYSQMISIQMHSLSIL